MNLQLSIYLGVHLSIDCFTISFLHVVANRCFVSGKLVRCLIFLNFSRKHVGFAPFYHATLWDVSDLYSYRDVKAINDNGSFQFWFRLYCPLLTIRAAVRTHVFPDGLHNGIFIAAVVIRLLILFTAHSVSSMRRFGDDKMAVQRLSGNAAYFTTG